MPARSLRIPAYSLFVALCAVLQVGTSHAQVPPRITIDSTPPGATVFVDGAMQGQSGPNFKVRINKGQHRVKLELEGHKPIDQVVTITAAQRLAFNLEKAPARLDVKYTAANDSANKADIYVDATPAGSVPQLIDLPAGRHLVEIKKSGFKVYSENVEVKAGETRPLWVALIAEIRAGGILVGADVADADVFVDGQLRGRAPLVVDGLNEGEHVVEVRRNEAGAPTWRQTVRVVTGQQVKVMAQTLPPPPAAGSLLVLSSVSEAEITVDANVKGKVGQPISLAPGQHSVALTAPGYNNVTRVVTIEPGKPLIEKIDLVGSPLSRGVGFVRIIMLTPVDAAQYFINGRRIDESAALSDQGIEVAAGRVVVMVQKDGAGQAKREVNLRPGSTETLEFELRNVGRLYIATQPPGAFVILDRNLVGQTPLSRDNVPAGPHTIELQKDKFVTLVEQVTVSISEQASVSYILKPAPPEKIDEAALQKNLSSFSAVTNPLGHFTGDLGSGFPYLANIRLTVGVLKKPNATLGEFGIDAGAEFRTTMYSQFEGGGNLRMQLFKRDPFAIGIFTYFGGGGGPRGRNSVQWEIGPTLTLLAGSMVKLTARPYLQVYSDRNCPAADNIRESFGQSGVTGLDSLGNPISSAEHSGDACVGRGSNPDALDAIYGAAGAGYKVGPMGTPVAGGIPYNPLDSRFQGGTGTGVLERYTDARFFLQAVVELAVSQNIGIYGLLEGAPGSRQRQQFSDKFNRIFPIEDPKIYGRIGATFKF